MLILLRGTPASGKSTWIRENNLEQYVLGADSIRLLYQSPVLNSEGKFVISQNNDGKVWKLLFELLEDRMSRGELTIVDATHYKSTLLNRYKELIKKYRYRAIVADFTDVPLETLIERNKNRDEFKRVPEEVIIKMHTVFQDDKEVSNRFNVVNKDELLPILAENSIKDFNHYNKIVFIGDIHGCFEPLKNYFDEAPFDSNTFYIFLGDYIDRGIQNKEVLEFLLNIRDFNNVLLLEGNHDRYIRTYAEDDENKDITEEECQTINKFFGKDKVRELKRKKTSEVFRKKTLPQIESLNLKELRQLCRKFGQLAYFNYGDKVYLATHGGISNLPTIFTQTEDIIKGVGGYSEVNTIDGNFVNNTPENCISIHGHRNIFIDEAEQFDGRIYNLCDRVEKGGYLRILEVTKEGHEVKKYKNNIFDESLCVVEEKLKELPKSDNEIINQLNIDNDVNKKVLSNGVISYNFSRKVFNKGKWNQRTIRARGLFIDPKTSKIMARSYDKFFTW